MSSGEHMQTQVEYRLLEPRRPVDTFSLPNMQRDIPLYDEAERIARRIHEKTLEEITKYSPRKIRRERKSKPTRKPNWLGGK